MAVSATSGVALDPSAFLKLFITQVKYQDPTAPMDPSQMMSSLAQMTTVQNLNQLNQNFQQSFARELIGSQVTFTLNGRNSSGVAESARIVNGQAGVVVGGQFVPVSAITQIAPAPASGPASGQ